ncbi:hypothetical protein [Haloplanus aerogenes]|uniref:Uncharacterized protein n=1 Tax=Haloplanus aerogenes TaxID=660522 RepID=A0A3M0CXS3_9EURY|nr:hypothetical protein [Haloplanus aerogenes]AZH24893.1 hypothetical protein DU502_05695 [Haloplanus aerogenes]RMB13898.1 hypothetical protein ATH50_2341 [Haloplanus aerogenes]
MYTIPHTRSRCERLAARTESDSAVTALLIVPLLALVHPAVPVALLAALSVRWLGRAARSPTGHGRVRRPA